MKIPKCSYHIKKKNEFDIGAYVNVVNAGGFLYSLICILFYVKKTRT